MFSFGFLGGSLLEFFVLFLGFASHDQPIDIFLGFASDRLGTQPGPAFFVVNGSLNSGRAYFLNLPCQRMVVPRASFLFHVLIALSRWWSLHSLSL